MIAERIGGEAEAGTAAERHHVVGAVMSDDVFVRGLPGVPQQEAQRFVRMASLDMDVRTAEFIDVGEMEEERDAAVVVQVVMESLIGLDPFSGRRVADETPPQARLDLAGRRPHVARRHEMKNRVASDRPDGLASLLDVEVSAEQDRLAAATLGVGAVGMEKSQAADR